MFNKILNWFKKSEEPTYIEIIGTSEKVRPRVVDTYWGFNSAQKLLNEAATLYGMKVHLAYNLGDGKNYIIAERDGQETQQIMPDIQEIMNTQSRLTLLQTLSDRLDPDPEPHLEGESFPVIKRW